jgi:hypothetical protein
MEQEVTERTEKKENPSVFGLNQTPADFSLNFSTSAPLRSIPVTRKQFDLI